MTNSRMARWMWGLVSLLGACAAGCGGGGGLGMTGGSIPVGDEVIRGTVTLPSGLPLTGVTVSVATVSNGQSVPVNASVDASGSFTAAIAAQTQDVVLTFVGTEGTLKVVVPVSSLSTSAPFDAGPVTALTTIVARAIETDVSGNIDAPPAVVSTQLSTLTSLAAQVGGTPQQQTADITDPVALTAAANQLIIVTANSELTVVSQTPTVATATIGLDGVLGYIVVSGGSVPTLVPGQRRKVINLQVVRHKHTPSDIVSALGSVGVSTDTNTVSAKDQAQQNKLSAFSSFGGVTPFEALAIGSNPSSNGGFGLDPGHGQNYVNALVGP